jgi:hypothetical protein
VPASPAPSPTTAPAASATATPSGDPAQPEGFPLDPDAITDAVRGVKGARSMAIRGGPSVREVSEQRQTSGDPIDEDAYGWNCATHFEYEGMPAVDWYIQPGAPVRATMDGVATLLLNTTANAFDYYGVSREPYIGDPDRERAPLGPFPGPGGGMGVYVSVINDGYRTDYGHLSLAATIANVPAGAFGAPYSRSYAYDAAFATPQPTSTAAIVATWEVRRGDVIGFTGDAGYSEASHLHYQITRRSDGVKLCPTGEPQFIDGGWLLR